MSGDNSEPPQKKLKTHSIHDSLDGFKDFVVEEVINEIPDTKKVVVKGRFENKDGFAIVIMEKGPFVLEDMKHILTEETSAKKLFGNDIYGNYTSFLPTRYNSVKTVIIHPATEKHVKKYQKQNRHVVDETPERYFNITLPYLQKSQFNIQWVYNILNHSCESERIAYEDGDADTGFIMLPDLKWDGVTIENLYLLAIVLKKNIKSVRDLTQEHLPLLYNIRKKGTEAIQKKYGVTEDCLRIYFHYQPSYYHLHVHFSHVKVALPGAASSTFIMLSSVISNIELMSDYYQKVSLPFVVGDNDLLYQEYVDAGVLPKKSCSSTLA